MRACTATLGAAWVCAVQLWACDDPKASDAGSGAGHAQDAAESSVPLPPSDGGSLAEEGGTRDAALDGALGAGAPSGPFAPCAAPVACATADSAPLRSLLEAASFGVNARFVALYGALVLVAKAEDDFVVARILRPGESEGGASFRSFAVPSQPARPLAIAEGRLARTSTRPSIFVLACQNDRTGCHLLRAEAEQSEFAAWPGSELPGDFAPRGLVIDDAHDPALLCAYGNGLLCFSDRWQPAIAIANGLELHDVEVGPLVSVAIGSGGRWFKREPTASNQLGPWQEQPKVAAGGLTQVSVAGSSHVIVGDGGIQESSEDVRRAIPCAPASSLVAVVIQDGARSLNYGLDAMGQLYHLARTSDEPPVWCARQKLPLDSIRATDVAPCGASINLRVLSEKILFGQNLCVTL